MGDLESDTTIESVGPNRFRTTLASAWQAAFGINGGYLAAVAARAVGTCVAFPRPISMSCSFLGAARSGEAEVEVVLLKRSMRAETHRVTVRQSGEDVLQAEVWSAAPSLPGPQCSWRHSPPVPPWNDVAPFARTREHSAALWDNIELRVLPISTKGVDGAYSPHNLGWARIVPRACFGQNLWLHVGRLLIMADHCQFPAIAQALYEESFIAPTLHLHLSFHCLAPEDEWLLGEARGVAAGDGLIASEANIWSSRGELVASTAQQMLFTRMRPR